MFWTILRAQFDVHDQLASKHFPKIIISISTLNFPVLCKFNGYNGKLFLYIFTSQKQAAYEHSGAEGTRSVMSRSLLLRPNAAVKAPLDI